MFLLFEHLITPIYKGGKSNWLIRKKMSEGKVMNGKCFQKLQFWVRIGEKCTAEKVDFWVFTTYYRWILVKISSRIVFCTLGELPGCVPVAVFISDVSQVSGDW